MEELKIFLDSCENLTLFGQELVAKFSRLTKEIEEGLAREEVLKKDIKDKGEEIEYLRDKLEKKDIRISLLEDKAAALASENQQQQQSERRQVNGREDKDERIKQLEADIALLQQKIEEGEPDILVVDVKTVKKEVDGGILRNSANHVALLKQLDKIQVELRETKNEVSKLRDSRVSSSSREFQTIPAKKARISDPECPQVVHFSINLLTPVQKLALQKFKILLSTNEALTLKLKSKLDCRNIAEAPFIEFFAFVKNIDGKLSMRYSNLEFKQLIMDEVGRFWQQLNELNLKRCLSDNLLEEVTVFRKEAKRMFKETLQD